MGQYNEADIGLLHAGLDRGIEAVANANAGLIEPEVHRLCRLEVVEKPTEHRMALSQWE